MPQSKVISILMFFVSLVLSSCTHVPKTLTMVDQNTQQALVLENVKGHRTRLSLWEKSKGLWHKRLCSLAVIGRNGLARNGEKKEGDGRTPSGTFSMWRSFGRWPQIETGLVYTKVDHEDLWVDDPLSSDYNLWVKGTRAQSYEHLLRTDDVYDMAAVIEYNTKPVVPGAGSAIFLHIWRCYHCPTAGCVALPKRNLRKILNALDTKKSPVIVIP